MDVNAFEKSLASGNRKKETKTRIDKSLARSHGKTSGSVAVNSQQLLNVAKNEVKRFLDFHQEEYIMRGKIIVNKFEKNDDGKGLKITVIIAPIEIIDVISNGLVINKTVKNIVCSTIVLSSFVDNKGSELHKLIINVRSENVKHITRGKVFEMITNEIREHTKGLKEKMDERFALNILKEIILINQFNYNNKKMSYILYVLLDKIKGNNEILKSFMRGIVNTVLLNQDLK